MIPVHESVDLLPLERLAGFLDAHRIGEGPATARRLPGGHSNLTYEVRRGPVRVVVRRPPPPPFPPGAHDVIREARLLETLDAAPVRAPEVLASCADESIIGAPFYVMEFIEAATLIDEMPPQLAPARVGEEIVDGLVELHGIDWRAAGLEWLGRPNGYLERQLKRFTSLWDHNRTRELPAVAEIAQWLGAHLPDSPPSTIVHGDYRLGNVMFDVGMPVRLAGIVDWEMATIGDPLADLGYLTATWMESTDPPLSMFERSDVMREPGFVSRGELIARYEERSGREARAIGWYQTLALWKTIVFMEGNYKRSLVHGAADCFTATLDRRIAELASHVAQRPRVGRSPLSRASHEHAVAR